MTASFTSITCGFKACKGELPGLRLSFISVPHPSVSEEALSKVRGELGQDYEHGDADRKDHVKVGLLTGFSP